VKNRLGRDGGLSYTEFSYQLIQAHDYRVLHDRFGCNLQVAGSDQWGNIIAGVDLVRRTREVTVHALTAPLLVDSEGRKFGKSTGGGQLWLDAARSSPYTLYQYFVRVADEMVLPLLLRLTLLSVAECQDIAARHMEQPGRREGQRRLAAELLAMIHGPEAAEAAERASAVLFGGDMADEPLAVWEMLSSEVPCVELEGADEDLASLAVRAGVVRSKAEVRRNPAGLRLNGEMRQFDDTIAAADLHHGRYALLRWGKNNYVVIEAQTL
jgi:tyrosyl-tRNA synthetase